jgi:hypothetical protein
MKRFPLAALLCGGLVLVVMLVLAAFTPQVNAARFAAPALGRALGPLPQGISTPVAVLCNVSITTTSSIQNNNSYTTAIPVASYNNLAPFNGTIPPGTSIQPLDQWFVMGNATPGFVYTFEANPDLGGNYNFGMEIYATTALTLIAQNTDTGDGPGAKISTTLSGPGPFYVRVFQISSFCSGGTYKLIFSYVIPTSTPSRTPTPTTTIGPTPTGFAGDPGVDRFELNNDFESATTIGLDVKYDNLNFVQWDYDSGTWDNDFFKVRVKSGMLVTCRTLDLTPGTDTNLILYDNNLNGINGSDDVNRAGGDLSSKVAYYVTYDGWLYGLVGEGFTRPQNEQANYKYSYECTITSQFTPTPAPTPTDLPNVPTRTPIPPTPTETLTPAPTLTPTPPFVRVIPLPTATSVGLPTTQVPISLLTYYDVNGNNKSDPGEGIVGISARVIDLTTGKLLDQGLTDTTGRVTFTVSAPGAVQLVVPYLNRSEIILPSGKSVTIRVNPSELPRAIP